MRIGAVLLGMLLAHSTQAAEPYSCRNGFFPAFAGAVRPAEVVADAGQRVHFRDDAVGCPEQASCIRRAYLVNGDELLVGREEDGWACGWYFSSTREFVGWLPSRHVRTDDAMPAPTASDWVGRWLPIAGGNRILITHPSPDSPLTVEGEAMWQGGRNSDGEPIVHIGAFSGHARPSGDLLTISEGDDEFDCQVTLQHVAGHLVVTDNSRCGGLNVRFDDVYRKAD
ncbi:hypothetical protein [Stutzerimonas chloritidismutans]|uniref:hypothetical protein n=1 Tax=Stutzerimonas chloritidismutans TaxID=203192 RepID=UPI003F18DEE8